MQLEGKVGLSISEACQCARLGRSGFYRHFEEHFPREADTELRGQIQRICLENRCYGSRRVARELREQGRVVNRKRVIRLMQADNCSAYANGAMCARPTPVTLMPCIRT